MTPTIQRTPRFRTRPSTADGRGERSRRRARALRYGLAGIALLVTSAAIFLEGRSPTPATAQSGLSEAYALVDTWEGRSVQSPAGAVLQPAGLEATSEGLVVVDRGNHRIEVFDYGGALLRHYGRRGDDPGELDDPRDVAVDGGRVYVVERLGKRVSVFSNDGSPQAAWPLDLDEPWGITAAAGKVYVSDASGGRIVVLENGVETARWAFDGEPRGIDLAADGKLYVADPRDSEIEVIGAGGAVERRIAQPNPRFAPWDVSVDDNGELYAQGQDVILYYLAGATFSSQALFREGFQGVTHQPRQGVYGTVADEERSWHGIYGFAWRPKDGNPIAQWPYLGFPPGRFNAPHTVHAGEDGRIWVLDAWPRIQGFETDGRSAAQIVPDLTPSRRFEPVDLSVRPDGPILVGEPRWLSRLEPGGLISRSLRLRRGTTDFWLTATTLRDGGDRVAMLDSAGASVRDYGLTTTLAPIGSWPLEPAGSPWSLYWDLIAADDDPEGRVFAVDRGGKRIVILEAGQAVGGWSTDAVPIRADLGPQGHLFVLTVDGVVTKYDSTGRAFAAWDAGAVSAEAASEVSDVAVDDAGRVYTVDRAADTVRVWDLDPDLEPKPPELRRGACRLRGDKRVSPGSIVIGDSVTVTLSVGGDCPNAAPGADIVLAIDRSYSMLEGSAMTDTIAAALSFVDSIDLVQDRVGLVSFNNNATLAQPLTNDRAAVRAAIQSLRPIGGTNIAAALGLAAEELLGARGRADMQPIIVLLTDGKDNDEQAVLDRARQAKREGIRLFTIGFGEVDPMVMVLAASTPEDSYYAPDSSKLGDIYAEIARRLVASSLARSMTITDELPTNMRFVRARSLPAPQVNGRVLTWTLTDLPFTGVDLRYEVEPQELGIHPTNVEAEAEFIDGLEEPGSLRFPIPRVEVLDVPPTVTPTPTAFPTPTPRPPTSTPRPLEPIFMPLVLKQQCRDETQRADVALVMDTSGSMALPAGEEGGPTRLEAAVSAASQFVTILLQEAGNRAAIVRFDTDASLVAPLSEDAAGLRTALTSLETSTGTRIDLGILTALEELTGERQIEANNRVMVLLTDGRVTNTSNEAVEAAAIQARDAGVLIFAIGLGGEEDVDFALLEAVASQPAYVFRAPSASDLQAIYAQIAFTIECPNLDWP